MDEKREIQQPEIPCGEVLFRVALRKGHITPDRQVLADLFLLRPDDNGELSVFRKERVSLSIVEGQFNKTRGSVTLHAGRVRDAGSSLERKFDVIVDEIPQIPGHAVITGLPDPEQEYAAAEFAASLLRDQCRLVSR